MKHQNNWLNSFKHAFNGMAVATSERHIRAHMVATVLVICTAFILNISIIEWLFVCSAIALVFISELINTCIETICDLISLDYSILIKKIKDIAAASVVISAIYAIAVALFILFPKINLHF